MNIGKNRKKQLEMHGPKHMRVGTYDKHNDLVNYCHL